MVSQPQSGRLALGANRIGTILTHEVVAIDNYGHRLKTVYSTFSLYEATNKISELRPQLDKRKRSIKGVQVFGYEMIVSFL